METQFSKTWNKSTQVRKQRKYRYSAPLHIKQKFMRVHLSTELKKKHQTRNVQVRKGDKVRVLRGQFKKKEGKVDLVDLKKEKVFITGIEKTKKDGTKVQMSFTPSNLLIIDLNLEDKIRKQKLTEKKTKVEVKNEKTS